MQNDSRSAASPWCWMMASDPNQTFSMSELAKRTGVHRNTLAKILAEVELGGRRKIALWEMLLHAEHIADGVADARGRAAPGRHSEETFDVDWVRLLTHDGH